MEQRTIVLIGKTGDGKSSAGNTILGENVFTTNHSANSFTAKCERRDGSVHGRKISVIDTPGFFDTNRDDEEIKSEIIKSLIECAPAVHAFVIVLKVGRYTIQENEVVQQFLNTMKGEHVLKHTVILFTHGDQLEGQTIEEFVKPNSQLQELISKCGGCCHVIDNKYWNDFDSGYKSNRVQVKNLLDTIDKMVKENDCFTNELLQKLEEEIQEEIKKNEDNLPLEEKRKKAKEIVHKKFWLQVVGATTGTLIGAFLGVVVAVAAVLALLKPFCSVCKLLKEVRGAVEEVAGGATAAEKMAGGAGAEEVGTGGAGAGVVGATTGTLIGAFLGVVVPVAEVLALLKSFCSVYKLLKEERGAVETVAEGAAAVETVAEGAAAVETVEEGAGVAGAAAGAGVGAVKAVAAGVFRGAALAGAVGGGVTGWKAAEEADSVCDAMTKAAKLNCENARDVIEKVQELVHLVSKNKLE